LARALPKYFENKNTTVQTKLEHISNILSPTISTKYLTLNEFENSSGYNTK